MSARGWCPECYDHQAINKDGTLRAHPSGLPHCADSGTKPTHLWLSRDEPMEPVEGETRAAFWDEEKTL